MIVIPVERIVQWRRTHGSLAEQQLPERHIKTRYVPSVKGLKTKRRTPSAVILDESLGIKSADVAAADQVKVVRILLNKLTQDNSDEVEKELNTLKICGLDALHSLGRLFISKVIQEPVFWDNYIGLVERIKWCCDQWTLRDCLLVEIQKYFENIEEMDKMNASNLMKFLAKIYNHLWLPEGVYACLMGRLLEKQASMLKVEYAIVFLKACPSYPSQECLRENILSRPSLTTRLRMLLVCK